MTLFCYKIIPESYFETYNIQLDSFWSNLPYSHDYVVDVDNDNIPEFFHQYKIDETGNCIEFNNGKTFSVIYTFENNEFSISRTLTIADIDNDHKKELIFVSGIDKVAYLNIMKLSSKDRMYYPDKKIAIDSFRLLKKLPDIENYYIKTSGSDIYFDLHAGFTIQPRHIYKYNYENNTLKKTDTNSIVCSGMKSVQYNDKDYLLATLTMATGNTASPEKIRQYKNAQDQDSILKYQKKYKNKEYKYGDFSSYILLYDNNLNYAFPPIEFPGWTNMTISDFFIKNDSLQIIAVTKTRIKENDKQKLVTICDLQGNIKKQIPSPFNFSELFTNGPQIVLYDDVNLYLYDNNLNLTKTIKNVVAPKGFTDLDNDGNKEFFAYNNDNNIVIYSENFTNKTIFNIEQEFAPYAEWAGITKLNIKGKPCFYFNSKLYYYILSYKRNPYSIFRYPFYIIILCFWLGVLLLLVDLHTYLLKKEKKQLEKVVSERTTELAHKNKNLKDLDKFKQIMVNTIAHDLKTPLTQILASSNDKSTTNLAGRMLMLITNMLDIEKYEYTSFIIDKKPYPVIDIIKSVINGLEISLYTKNIKVLTHADNINVYTDKSILIRILDNLLSNAIRYSPQNQTIEITALLLSNKKVEISIKNYGKNIPEHALNTIFDKYKQLEHNTTHANTTGLGLTFCQMAIQAHGHSIKAKNFDGGVIFSFTLDGEEIIKQNKEDIISFEKNTLNTDEIEMLKPWLEQLKPYEIYQTSELISIIKNIPDTSDSIIAYKQKITDAIFASNTELYILLTKL
jgi:signal transduction histidine kinase